MNGVSQVNGSFRLVPVSTCRLGGGGLNKGTMVSISTLVLERAALPTLTQKLVSSVPS